jgi:transcriptional regulator with XRE-family HTH domain
VASALGTLMRAHRERRGLSQRALARAVGVTPAYISLIERGERRPEASVVERLAAALAGTDTQRTELRRAAGYADPEGALEPAPALAHLHRVIRDPALAPEQQATIEALVVTYAVGLVRRAREGKPLVADLAAPWQVRVLEAIQEKLTEDSQQADAYLNRLFDL